MKKSINKLFNEAKSDNTFRNKLVSCGEEYHTPRFWWGGRLKALYAAIYMGYLVALGRFNEDNYR